MTETSNHQRIKDLSKELARQARELSILSAKDGVKYSIIDGKCTLWQGSLDKGIPVWYYKGEKLSVRRVVYEYRKGLIPKGFYVKMTCGKPECIQNEHMELVTNLRPRTDLDSP